MFADIEPDTANIDPGLIEDAITPRTKAILPVDAFGQPARLDVIREIADRHGLVVIEDSCESLGSEHKGIKAGNGIFSHGAVFAFYPNKQITTGEGGMIITDDDRMARLCRSMSDQGRGEAGVWLSRERLGQKCPMERRTRTPSNVSAAAWCRAPKLGGIQAAPPVRTVRLLTSSESPQGSATWTVARLWLAVDSVFSVEVTCFRESGMV